MRNLLPPPPCPLSVFVPDFCLYFSLAAAFPSLPTHSVQDIWEDKPQTRAETNLQNVTFQRFQDLTRGAK